MTRQEKSVGWQQFMLAGNARPFLQRAGQVRSFSIGGLATNRQPGW
jgi:hypothetical protein